MKLLAWFCAVAWACAAFGCSSSTNKSPDLIGFTFQTDVGSFSSFGWTGAFHDIVAPVGTPFGVKVTQCNGDVCQFEGPSDVASDVKRRRCLRHMSKTCDTDSDCTQQDGTPSPCVYIYDPPLTTGLKGSDSKVGACGWSYIPIAAAGQPATIRGTLNLVSNALELENLTVDLALNRRNPTSTIPAGTFFGACAECVGDIKANDGLKQGTCKIATHLNQGDIADMSIDLGMPCDVNRYGTTDSVYNAGYSMDCSPTLDPGQPLPLGGSFSSSGFQVSITDDSPDCTTGGKCFCGMCSDHMTACMSNKDCHGGQCSIPSELDCDPNLPPPATGYDNTIPVNQCRTPPTDPQKFLVAGDECDPSSPCKWDAEKALGRCTSKLIDPTDPKGQRHLTLGCYPSDVGAMISGPGRSDRIDDVGTVYLANTAGASCIPAGTNAQLNSQVGLPGLLFQRRNFQIIPEYAEDQK